jgi:hypothetical protein
MYRSGQGHGKKPLEFDCRSKSSFTPLPWEDIYPPGLYTVITHNCPLRTRIQGHLDELEEFKARVRRAQFLVSGFWLACWLVPSYATCGMGRSGMCLPCVIRAKSTARSKESRAQRLVNLYERDIRARILWIPCIAWIKQAMLFRCITSLTHRPHIWTDAWLWPGFSPPCSRFGILPSKRIPRLEVTWK